MQQNKKTILTVSVIFIVTVVILCTVYWSHFSKTTGEQQQVQQAAQSKLTVDQEQKLQQQVADIVSTKDLSKCDQVQDETYKKVCINNIALNLAQETKNISYCQKIDNKLVPIADCEREIVLNTSIEKENISICNQASDQQVKTDCQKKYYPSLAIKKNDQTICNSAATDTDKANCKDEFVFRTQFMNDPQKTDCTLFANTDTKADCVLIEGATKNTDPSVCSQVKSLMFSQYCVTLHQSPMQIPNQLNGGLK